MSDCGQELCPFWPGQGCLNGVLDCPEPEDLFDEDGFDRYGDSEVRYGL